MFRVTKMSKTVFAVDMGDFRDIDDEGIEAIHYLASEGNFVVICDDLEDAASIFEITVSDIEIVKV